MEDVRGPEAAVLPVDVAAARGGHGAPGLGAHERGRAHLATGRHAEDAGLDPRAGERGPRAVHLLVAGDEAVDLGLGQLGRDLPAGDGHLDLVDLEVELHVGEAADLHLLAREPLRLQLGPRAPLELGEDRVERLGVERGRHQLSLLVHVEHVGGHHAEGGPGGGEVAQGHNDAVAAQLAGEPGGVRAAGAAVGVDDEPARVEALLQGHLAHQVGHLRLDDADGAGRRLDLAHPHGPGDGRHGAARRLPVQGHLPAEEVVGVVAAEHHVGVARGAGGRRRGRSRPAPAGRPRSRDRRASCPSPRRAR